ncbi:hypothetical protein ACFQ61_06520 [Streptomyces sp. NPDC056500]
MLAASAEVDEYDGRRRVVESGDTPAIALDECAGLAIEGVGRFGA